MLTIHPWNHVLWDRLLQANRSLPSGLLFAGPMGLGKNALALRLAAWRLCSDTTDIAEPCGTCQSCRLVSAGTHPDLHIVQSEVANAEAKSPLADLGRRYLWVENTSRSAKPKSVIGVNPIRALVAALLNHAHFGHGKVAIIGPAERMNTNSANALLKLLEEPADDTLLILVSSMPTRLLATIRSRCMRVEFAAPAVPVAVDWLAPQVGSDAEALLALSGGAPLSAAALSENGFPGCRDEWLDDVAALASRALDPLTCAARWHQAGSTTVLEWLHGLIADLIGLASGATPPRLFNLGRESQIRPLAVGIPAAALHDLFDTIGRRRLILDGSVDERLLVEDIVIKLRETLIGRGPNTIQLTG